jgi:3-hydroxyacyl-[acyl-carrier-protein] dehydratase
MTRIEYAEICGMLPHRNPILLVDRVLDVLPGERIVAVKAVTGGEECFAGLGPEDPAAGFRYPRSLILESFCQAAGLLWHCSIGRRVDADGQVPMFASASRIEFLTDVFPGDVMRHEVCIDSAKASILFVSGSIHCGSSLIAEVGNIIVASGSMDSISASVSVTRTDAVAGTEDPPHSSSTTSRRARTK